MVLEKHGFWPSSNLKLSCEKEKYFNCQTITNYKLYIKGKQYESFIKLKEYSDNCNKFHICNECIFCKEYYKYVQKKYYI